MLHMCCKVWVDGAISKTETAEDSVGGTQETGGGLGLGLRAWRSRGQDIEGVDLLGHILGLM